MFQLPAPSAEEFYARAVEQMRHHPNQAFATYEASISGLNCRVTAGGMECTLGRSTAESERPFPVKLRQSDGRVAINSQERPIVLGDSTFINPTWPSIDAIIRRGFTGMGALFRARDQSVTILALKNKKSPVKRSFEW
jgi:hypothetical protein